MKVTGSATVHVPRDELWKALNDPAVLVRTIPGCSRLEEISPDAYRMTIYAGVASIKGTYQGEVRLADQHQPDSFVLHASGAGAPGTVNADVSVHLSDQGSTTLIDYDADAVVGGMIGGVGQRVLGGVAKKTAGEFFSAVEGVVTGAAADQAAIGQTSPDELAVGGPSADQSAVGRPPADQVAAGRSEAAAGPRVFEAPVAPRRPAASLLGADVRGVLVGAAIALLGALVGGWISGRRRS